MSTLSPTKPIEGMSESAVVRIVGEEHRRLVRTIDNLEMDYGTHWRWQHNSTFYTVAGLDVLIEELHVRNAHAAAIALKVERDRILANKATEYWWQKEGAA